ncbi:MAG TPA: hypothetical protein VJR30_14800 [Bradyrhizobium sp.]|nr:hypothetical protein [Bradyrhizobium sp.]
MSIKTKIAALALATLAVTGSIAATTTKAEAYPLKPWGYVGAGIATAAIVGTAIAASNDGYYGYRRCGWAPRYNVFGQYVGSVRVCNY